MNKLQLIAEINRIKVEKNAVIMAHYYQNNDIQDIADFIGDSLALAQQAAKTDADILVICGVHFMGETAKILSPDKKVLIPDKKAGCSLADSCPADAFETFIKKYPGHKVISYVNTSAAVKALTDVVVTSTNAVSIVQSFSRNQKIIFGPDRNLGNYINSLTGRNMVLWDGACHVHEQFSLEKLIELKKEYPLAKMIAHPECKQTILMLADFIGSTASLLKYVQRSDNEEFIIATESGILHQMKKSCPEKIFIPLPPNDSTCGCNECSFMRLNTLEKLYHCLKNETPAIEIEEEIRLKAEKPILKMLKLSKKLGL
ncbi:MAG: quinolinate synthase NadA [Bacteroidales bacterium]|nr:quinolinate synthase NadA [Bacteroidales bacterium]MDD3907603.1 quinolinate synthase NadA [Bacteroidales bacterium]MDD4711748.1 quinolinate synthase NadA [Bacteroidales bacterium]